MRIKKNEVTGISEGYITGTLGEVPTEFPQKNSKETNYAVTNVDIAYPDGSTDTVRAVMYENSAKTGLFKAGSKVELRIQLEGDFAGNATIQLAGNKVDLTKFGIKATEAVTAEV